MDLPRRFVYILKSIASPHEHYVGLTSDPHARLAAHNHCPRTRAEIVPGESW